jgi:hypothetical protein
MPGGKNADCSFNVQGADDHSQGGEESPGPETIREGVPSRFPGSDQSN